MDVGYLMGRIIFVAFGVYSTFHFFARQLFLLYNSSRKLRKKNKFIYYFIFFLFLNLFDLFFFASIIIWMAFFLFHKSLLAHYALPETQWMCKDKNNNKIGGNKYRFISYNFFICWFFFLLFNWLLYTGKYERWTYLVILNDLTCDLTFSNDHFFSFFHIGACCFLSHISSYIHIFNCSA